MFFPFLGAIFLPSYGNITYVNKESNVSLPWRYDFGDAAIVLKQWSFRNTSSSSDFTPLVYLSCNTTTVDPLSPFKNIDVFEAETLFLKNVNHAHNGTYKFTVTVVGIRIPPSSEIQVVIQGIRNWFIFVVLNVTVYMLHVFDILNVCMYGDILWWYYGDTVFLYRPRTQLINL